jgi:hypothetical protein
MMKNKFDAYYVALNLLGASCFSFALGMNFSKLRPELTEKNLLTFFFFILGSLLMWYADFRYRNEKKK